MGVSMVEVCEGRVGILCIVSKVYFKLMESLCFPLSCQ